MLRDLWSSHRFPWKADPSVAQPHSQDRGIVGMHTRRGDEAHVRLVPGLVVMGEFPEVARAADAVAVVEVEFVFDLGFGLEVGLDLDLGLGERQRWAQHSDPRYHDGN